MCVGCGGSQSKFLCGVCVCVSFRSPARGGGGGRCSVGREGTLGPRSDRPREELKGAQGQGARVGRKQGVSLSLSRDFEDAIHNSVYTVLEHRREIGLFAARRRGLYQR